MNFKMKAPHSFEGKLQNIQIDFSFHLIWNFTQSVKKFFSQPLIPHPPFSSICLNRLWMWLTSLPMTKITYIRACFAASLTILEGLLIHSLFEVIRLISCSASTGNQKHRLQLVLIRAHTSLCHSLATACLYPKYNWVLKQRLAWVGGGI